MISAFDVLELTLSFFYLFIVYLSQVIYVHLFFFEVVDELLRHGIFSWAAIF